MSKNKSQSSALFGYVACLAVAVTVGTVMFTSVAGVVA